MGLTLLAQAKLPIKFWSDSFHTATHIINRLPTPVLSMKTPYECLFHLLLDYPFLKTFGCVCFPFLRDYDHHKFDFHTSKCVFLGYSPLHKGYKCLHPSGKIYIASHVLFYETSFSYSTDSHFLKSLPPKVSDFQYSSLQFYNISVPHSNLKPFEAAAADTDSHTSSSNHNIMLPSFSTHPVSFTDTISSPIIHTTSPITTPNTTSAPIIHHHSPESTVTHQVPLHTSPSIPSLSFAHPMITIAKPGIFKPKAFLTAHNSLEPSSVDEALADPKWQAAMQLEYRVRLWCNGDTVSPLHPVVGSTWMNGSSGIQRLGVTVIPYHRCTVTFSWNMMHLFKTKPRV